MSKIIDIIEDLRNIEDLTGPAQEVLVSGTNIKTVGGQSLLGSGDILIKAGSNIPLGVVIPIASNLVGAHSIPLSGVVDNDGWMYCDGSVIPGGNSVSGSVPNLTDGRFIRGFSSSGGTGGSDAFILAEANIPAHTHTIPAHTHTGSTNTTGAHTHTINSYVHPSQGTAYSASGVMPGSSNTSSNGDHSHTITINYGGSGITGSTGSTTAVAHIPKYINMKFIIKVN